MNEVGLPPIIEMISIQDMAGHPEPIVISDKHTSSATPLDATAF
jgi:hypothetical protein